MLAYRGHSRKLARLHTNPTNAQVTPNDQGISDEQPAGLFILARMTNLSSVQSAPGNGTDDREPFPRNLLHDKRAMHARPAYPLKGHYRSPLCLIEQG